MKCPAHGFPSAPPQHQVSAAGYAAAIPAGLVLSAIASAVSFYVPFLLGTLVIGIVSGSLIGEAMSYCSGWKRGPHLATVAAVTVVLGSLSGPFLVLLVHAGLVLHLDNLKAGVLLEPVALVFGALAAVAAYWRIR